LSYKLNTGHNLTVWVTNDLDNLGFTPAANLTVHAVEQVETAAYKLPSPTFVTNAVGPEVVMVERGEGGSGVTDKTAGGVGVHAEQERDKEVVSVPEGLKRLLSYPVVSGRVDQQHAEKHNVSSNTASFGVVDLESNLRANLSTLNVEEAEIVSNLQISEHGEILLDVMGTSMENREEEHGVCDLFVEPHVLVERRPSNLWSEPSENVSAHGHNDHHSVDR
jgi:hypothetical protein